MKGFKVYQIDAATSLVPAYSRRDFYTICLLTGPRQLQSTNQKIEFDGTCLCFGHPHGAEAERRVAARQTGYACRFTKAFFKENGPVVSQEQWALFNGHATRTFSLREEQATYLTSSFQKMLAEQQTPYVFKHELLRTYLQLVVHEAMRLRLPAPKRLFRYYVQQPGPLGELSAGWRSRQRRLV